MRLRVIAGQLGGRLFEAPEGFTTHPMSERIRGSLFNILGDISGQTVLDAYAGSGALSFEALSRGAASALAIERDRVAQKVIAKNIQALGLSDKMQLVKAGCGAWSATNPQAKFDLILCDPPYNNVKLSTISELTKHLNQNGLMVLSHPGRGASPTVNGVVVVDNRNYGDAALTFYRLKAA